MAEPHIIHKVLKQYWGYDEFRPLQEDIILSVLNGSDTLALLPTGGGKSICFQVPAMALDGICIVVSPLISLMQDQVENLLKRGIKAASISAANSRREIDVLLDNCIYGGVKFLYLSPERLKSELFLERFKQMKVCLLAIDEAHCISQWGYDFRPEYLLVADVREFLPDIPVLALTATATPEVVEDIQKQLQFKRKNVFQKSFERSNLAYVVQYEESKMARLLNVINKIGGSGIVYLRSRNKTTLIAKELRARGISCESYHAGLKQETRKKRQQDWIDGSIQAVAATNAFGMGIDKPDVRWVVHLDLPDSLEAYFQEAGRAGRDGKKSYAVTLYDEADTLDLLSRVEAAFPDIKEIKRIYRALGNFLQIPVGGGKEESFPFEISDFAKRYNLPLRNAYVGLGILEKEGYITLSDAFHHPAKVQIYLDKKGIYDLSVQNSEPAKVLDILLRSYSGFFDTLVVINEGTLATRLGWKKEDVILALQKLKKMEAIEYIPTSDSPMVYFSQERLHEDNFSIDKKLYAFRKKRAIENAKSVITYVSSTTCRSALLVAHFGQKGAKDCGVCDVCLEKKKMINEPGFLEIVELIRNQLKAGVFSVTQLKSKLKKVSTDQLFACLDWMEDSSEISIENDRILLP